MRILNLALTRVIVPFLLASPSTKSMVGADQSPPTSNTAADFFDGVEKATGSDGISDPRIQNRRRGKAKAKASKIGHTGDGKSSKSHKRLEKCAAQFIGTRTYGGSCDKSFTATIGCEESLNDCFYQEESFDGSTSSDVCYPFDMAEVLSIDGNTCMLGFANGGILLKNSAHALDPNCEPKYVLKMTIDIGKESSDELLLYFSSDGGKSFYNEDDPRVATRASEDEIHARRAEVCTTSSSCGADGSRCFYGDGDSCSDCCSGVHGTSIKTVQEDVKGSLSDHTCTCMPSFPRLFQSTKNPGARCCVNDGAECKNDYWDPGCNFVGDGCCMSGYWSGGCCSGKTFQLPFSLKDFIAEKNTMNKPSHTFCGCFPSGTRCGYENQYDTDTGCVKGSQDQQGWVFPAYYYGSLYGVFPIGTGKWMECCSGEIVFDDVIQHSTIQHSTGAFQARVAAYKCK